MSITNIQKDIYNYYLRAYRVNNNKPFRPKKNFSDVEKNPQILNHLLKLEYVFKTYPHFLNENYFDAPYKIYKDESPFYGLDFYSSSRGISTCIAYYKYIQKSLPSEQLEYIRDSLRFIAEFCIEKRIRLNSYISYATVVRPDCLKHLKEYRISWYVVFLIPGFIDLIRDMPKDEFELYFGDSIDVNRLYINYYSDTKLQKMLKDMYLKIYYFIDNNLKKSNINDK